MVQARTGSSRLPGKVLLPLGDRPMLAFMLARLEALQVDELVVATSTEASDDAVAELAEAAGLPVVRGSETDVLARFIAAVDAHPAATIVRLTADCPFMDPEIVHQALAVHATSDAAYTSNTLVRTYPDGLDVEVVAAAALRVAAAESVDPVEHEHVTPFVYRRPERFTLRAALGRDLLGDERWTVDTAGDLERARAIVAALPDPVHAGWREILAASGRRPTTGGIKLRPARGEDDELFVAQPPPVPFGRFAAEPAVRSWVALDEGSAVGWAQVAVRSGAGRLRRWTDPSLDSELIARVERALADDCQVCELAIDG